MLIKIFKIELRKNKYTNRGYILDGFPETYKQFFYLYKINKENEEEDDSDQKLDDTKEIPEDVD